MHAGQKGDFQLRPYPVGTADEHRLGNAGQVGLKQAAEAADA